MKPQSVKQRLGYQANQLWILACIKAHGQVCEICGKPGQQVHHFYPKGNYGHLRYNIDNGIILCKGCHFQLHHTNNTLNLDIVKKRGQEWIDALEKKAKDRPKGSYCTVKWYNNEIERLKEAINQVNKKL